MLGMAIELLHRVTSTPEKLRVRSFGLFAFSARVNRDNGLGAHVLDGFDVLLGMVAGVSQHVLCLQVLDEFGQKGRVKTVARRNYGFKGQAELVDDCVKFEALEGASAGEAPFGFHVVEVHQRSGVGDQMRRWRQQLNDVCGLFERLLQNVEVASPLAAYGGSVGYSL